MNQRYVDDINIAVKATVPGLRYVEGHHQGCGRQEMSTRQVVADLRLKGLR